MVSYARLMQDGYMYVSSFNRKEQADTRASFYREQGNEAKVLKKTDSSGSSLFLVFIKLKEV